MRSGRMTGNLYYHFPTKEALIQAVVSHLTEELKKTRGLPKDAPATAREELSLEFEDIRELLRVVCRSHRTVAEGIARPGHRQNGKEPR